MSTTQSEINGSYSVDKIPEYYFHASIKDSVVDLLMRGSKS